MINGHIYICNSGSTWYVVITWNIFRVILDIQSIEKKCIIWSIEEKCII